MIFLHKCNSNFIEKHVNRLLVCNLFSLPMPVYETPHLKTLKYLIGVFSGMAIKEKQSENLQQPPLEQTY